jgi:aspartate/methionine/tyrosine aminotransferase
VDIAREHDLFLLSDEIYANIVYGESMVPLSQVINGVPGIAMKGLSKEVPWPGARCGWIEVYNKEKDPVFARYVKTLVDAKMLEVCSTTLPQQALPKIMSDARYATHLDEVAENYRTKAELFAQAFDGVKGVIANKPRGAFYAAVVFEDGMLTDTQTLPIPDTTVREHVETLVAGMPNDKRFVYYLMASTGITVVPLSGMNSHLDGFRITLLEPNREAFITMLDTLVRSIEAYTESV